MRSLGTHCSDEELVVMLNEIDENNDGFIDKNEFMILMSSKLNEGEMDEELLEAFKSINKSGSTYITVEEFGEFMK